MNINYTEIDIEIKPLIKALNKLDGIKTMCSCSGHNKEPITIFFKTNSINALNKILWAGAYRYWNFQAGWEIKVAYNDPDCNSNELDLLLESKDIGEEAYKHADILVEGINNYLENNKVRRNL